MKILAVDDDDIIRELLVETLAVSGFQDVTTAACAAEALERISGASEPYDCFLLDIQMPNIDGIELCHRIRKMPQYRKTPILMITAMSDKKYIDFAFDAGASDYVTKPFDILELGSRVKIAEDMVTRQRQTEMAELEVAGLKDRLGRHARIDISDPLHLDDVDRFLDFSAFENYLLLLTRKEYLTSGLLALRIANIRELYKKCSEKEFEDMITDVGEALSEVMVGQIDFLTYRGDGIYVCSFPRANKPDTENLRIALRREIEEMGLVYINGHPMHVTFEFGDPVEPGFFSAPGSAKLLTQAIDDLRTRNLPQDVDIPRAHRDLDTKSLFSVRRAM